MQFLDEGYCIQLMAQGQCVFMNKWAEGFKVSPCRESDGVRSWCFLLIARIAQGQCVVFMSKCAQGLKVTTCRRSDGVWSW